MNNSTIAILGANGRAGSAILKLCLQNGFKVKALFRDLHKCPEIDSNSLVKIAGNATEKSILEELISGCNIVINAISNKANPAPISSSVTALVIDIINKKPDVRYFVITGKTIKTISEKFSLSTFLERRIMEKAFPEIMRSKNEELGLLAKSSIKWTLIRIPLIVDKEIQKFNTSLTKCKGKEINRMNIASFIIDEIDKKEYLQKAPYLYE